MSERIRELISEKDIAKRIVELGAQISEDYQGESVFMLCVLKGGVYFTTELSKRMSVPVSLDFMAVSSYGMETESSGVVKIIKDHNFTIVQNNVYNYGEIDMKPIDKLVSFDPTHDIIYCNNILIECLKVLGYVDNQLYDIIDFSKNLRHVIPEDLADKLPIQNKKNSGCYQMIKELLC